AMRLRFVPEDVARRRRSRETLAVRRRGVKPAGSRLRPPGRAPDSCRFFLAESGTPQEKITASATQSSARTPAVSQSLSAGPFPQAPRITMLLLDRSHALLAPQAPLCPEGLPSVSTVPSVFTVMASEDYDGDFDFDLDLDDDDDFEDDD